MCQDPALPCHPAQWPGYAPSLRVGDCMREQRGLRGRCGSCSDPLRIAPSCPPRGSGLPGAALTTGAGRPGGSRGWACPSRCSSRGGGRPVRGPGAHTLGQRAWRARLQLSPPVREQPSLQGLPASPAPSLLGLGHSDPSASSQKQVGKKGRPPGEGPLLSRPARPRVTPAQAGAACGVSPTPTQGSVLFGWGSG